MSTEQMRVEHTLEFKMEGPDTYGWRVAYCPGVEGGCLTYKDEERTELFEGECGLQDWLDDIGGEMIHSDVLAFRVLAMHEWVHDVPLFKLVSDVALVTHD